MNAVERNRRKIFEAFSDILDTSLVAVMSFAKWAKNKKPKDVRPKRRMYTKHMHHAK